VPAPAFVKNVRTKIKKKRELKIKVKRIALITPYIIQKLGHLLSELLLHFAHKPGQPNRLLFRLKNNNMSHNTGSDIVKEPQCYLEG